MEMAVAHYLKINESSVRAVLQEEKETHEAVAAASPARMKPCTFWRNTFLSGIENAAVVRKHD